MHQCLVLTCRYANPDFGVLASGSSGTDFLSRDPYQFKLDVAEPVQRDDFEFEERGQPTQSIRPGSNGFDESPRSYAERRLEAEEALGGSAQDEQIGHRPAPKVQEEWDFRALSDEKVDVNACKWSRLEFGLLVVIRKALTGADDEEKKRFVAALLQSRAGNAQDLQKNVFKQCV